MAFTFLTKCQRAAWLASIDRGDPLLVDFGRCVDDLCRHALDQTGRELGGACSRYRAQGRH